MSKKHAIDELFRQKLENHAFEPPMELWDKIDQQRNRRKALLRRGLAVRLLVLSGVVLTLALAGWFTWDYFQSPATDNSSEIAVVEQQYEKLSEGENTTADKAQLKNLDDSPVIENAEIVQVDSEASIENAAIDDRVEKTDTELQEPIVSAQIPLTTNETAAIAQLTSDEQTLTDNQSFSNEDVDLESDDLISEEAAVFDFSKAMQGADVVSRLPSANKLLSKEDKGSADLPKRETDCPTFVGLPGGLYMDLNASIDLAQRSMTVRDPEMEAYKMEREKSEIPYFAFSAGFHLTALTERGFAIKSGVDYSQINESFNFDGGEVEIITILPGGDTTWEVKNLRIRATNRYQMVDIPLLAGYEHNFSNFSLSVYGGGFLNVKFAKKGNIVSSETMQPVGVTTGEPEKFARLFRENLGLGWYTSFGFAYKLQHGTQIRVEPYFRFYPKSFSAVDNVIDQRYFLTGIKVGVRKRL